MSIPITNDQFNLLTRLVFEVTDQMYVGIDDLRVRAEIGNTEDGSYTTLWIIDENEVQIDLSELMETHELFLEDEITRQRYALDKRLTVQGDFECTSMRLVADPPVPEPTFDC